jgi:hypothetical protein
LKGGSSDQTSTLREPFARRISMKIISILQKLSMASKADRQSAGAAGGLPEWIRDPLAHPDLDVMSERELADLPFRRAGSQLASLDCVRG